MERTVNKKMTGWWVTGILIVCIALAFNIPVLADQSQPRVIRVGFTEMEGLMEKDEDGYRHGLIIDYLNEIAKYTGWEYEYIDLDAESLLEEFDKGHFEIIGGNYYLPGLEEYYAYPDYDIGTSKAVLLARKDDDRVRSADLRSLNGKTIGVYERANENIRRLKEFLSMNGLDCTLKYYAYEQLTENGNLYPYLECGEVDLLLGNNTERENDFRTVISYDSQPYYIVTNVGNKEVLDGLNMAMEKITDSNPNFAAERYAANFTNWVDVDIVLNEEETEYIRQIGSVTVALPKNFHPLSCRDNEELHNGLLYDLFEEITAFTGLKFTYKYTDSYSDAVRLVQNREADILGFYLGSEENSAEQGLALTASYASLNSIVVRNKAASFPSAGLVGAVIEGQKLPGDIQADEVKIYASMRDALKAVNRGDADFVYSLSAYLEWEIQRNHFANVIPVTIRNDRDSLCFALARPVDSRLLTILNKAVNQIPGEKKSQLLDQNLVSTGTGSLTLSELVYANPVTFIGILTALLLTLVLVVLWINRTKMRAAMMKSELEKAEAESRAKGEFLSRMSHELRTPMNAVVGLADLSLMTKEIPNGLRENLEKLRASSQYLLDLINDILDMSRIDSGMLSISSEPFSVNRLLEALKIMMEGDAEQRGLTYELQSEILHGSVVGDGIRLRQVLTNLLSNAFKFTPAGGTVVLKVTESGSSEDSAVFTFQVIDSGVGIALEDQKRIFESFEQVGTNYSKSQGTGLGLPISSRIVELMGGKLCVRSRPDYGSEFYFTLTFPLGEEDEQEDEAEQDGQSEDREELSGSAMLKGLHILLAEDNDLNAEIAVQLLELQGASVCRTENGKQVLDRFEQSGAGEFQVILMDIQMPEMNGLEAARAIRSLKRPDAADIPIVAMTANAFKEDMDAAMEAGMNGFVSKPLDIQYLYRVIMRLMENRGKQETASEQWGGADA